MKRLSLSAMLLFLLFSNISIGWAEPYKNNRFPGERVFEKYKGKEYISIGKWMNDHETYWVFGFYRLKGGTISADYLGMFIRLDNDYWMKRDSTTEPWQLFDPEKKK